MDGDSSKAAGKEEHEYFSGNDYGEIFTRRFVLRFSFSVIAFRVFFLKISSLIFFFLKIYYGFCR